MRYSRCHEFSNVETFFLLTWYSLINAENQNSNDNMIIENPFLPIYEILRRRTFSQVLISVRIGKNASIGKSIKLSEVKDKMMKLEFANRLNRFLCTVFETMDTSLGLFLHMFIL